RGKTGYRELTLAFRKSDLEISIWAGRYINRYGASTAPENQVEADVSPASSFGCNVPDDFLLRRRGKFKCRYVLAGNNNGFRDRNPPDRRKCYRMVPAQDLVEAERSVGLNHGKELSTGRDRSEPLDRYPSRAH